VRKVLLHVAFLAPFCISACTSMSARIKQENYDSWSPAMQHAVDNKQLVPGMSKLQVLAVTDVPEVLVQKRTTIARAGVIETWVLYKSFGSYYYANTGIASTVVINFLDGAVDTVSY